MENVYYVHPYTPQQKGWVHTDKGVKEGAIADAIQGGWNLPRNIFASTRNDIHKYAALSQWRGYANGTMVGGFGVENQARGFAFLWMDFWNAPGAGNQPFMNRTSDVMSRQNSPSFVEPGPDGPVATVRYEMLREGLQETEARIAIERALVGKTIEGDLATRSRAFLQKMIQVRFLDNQFEGGHAGGNLGKPDRMWGLEDYPAWMNSSAALFDLAAEVQKAAQKP